MRLPGIKAKKDSKSTVLVPLALSQKEYLEEAALVA
jgi:hypothetical protein